MVDKVPMKHDRRQMETLQAFACDKPTEPDQLYTR